MPNCSTTAVFRGRPRPPFRCIPTTGGEAPAERCWLRPRNTCPRSAPPTSSPGCPTTPDAHAFATRHGYRRSRPGRFLRLDLAGADLPPLPGALPSGVRLCTGADFDADPYPLFAADAEATTDEPGDVAADAMAYEDWLRHTWEHPDIDLDLTSVVTVERARSPPSAWP